MTNSPLLPTKDVSIGQLIAVYRKVTKMGRNSFGKLVGCSGTYIEMVEKGIRRPKFDFGVECLKAMGYEVMIIRRGDIDLSAQLKG